MAQRDRVLRSVRQIGVPGHMTVMAIAERGEALKPLYWMAPETSWSSPGGSKHTRVEDHVTTGHHELMLESHNSATNNYYQGSPPTKRLTLQSTSWAKRAHKRMSCLSWNTRKCAGGWQAPRSGITSRYVSDLRLGGSATLEMNACGGNGRPRALLVVPQGGAMWT